MEKSWKKDGKKRKKYGKKLKTHLAPQEKDQRNSKETSKRSAQQAKSGKNQSQENKEKDLKNHYTQNEFYLIEYSGPGLLDSPNFKNNFLDKMDCIDSNIWKYSKN